jgi:hypothetical protein
VSKVSVESEGGLARPPHPAAVAEMTLRDLEENQGWQVTLDEAGERFLVTCPHGTLTYPWPVALDPGWRWNDHFKRMIKGHKESCAEVA